ncbi:uncharacterized protein LOC110117760 [Ceratitis capitata]|uniref:uncharacterized protein LOC110117760 n=1 Tax=Ceratitis capitata TaxID=7213 RepID=UPI000A0FBCBD|nr:uncharacterized protein LOC110117760 [Ceratitis capitata]
MIRFSNVLSRNENKIQQQQLIQNKQPSYPADSYSCLSVGRCSNCQTTKQIHSQHRFQLKHLETHSLKSAAVELFTFEEEASRVGISITSHTQFHAKKGRNYFIIC